MSLKKALLGMVEARDGGVDSFSLALGLPVKGLHNRIYADDGMNIGVKYGLKMQEMSKTTFFAEAIANLSGGTFVKLPEVDDVDNEELLAQFNKLYARIGQLAGAWNDATADNYIDPKEKQNIQEISNGIHMDLQTLVALSFKLFCK